MDGGMQVMQEHICDTGEQESERNVNKCRNE